MTNVPYMLDEENQLQYLVLVWSNAPSDHHQLVSNQCIEGEGLEENKYYSDVGDTDIHLEEGGHDVTSRWQLVLSDDIPGARTVDASYKYGSMD